MTYELQPMTAAEFVTYNVPPNAGELDKEWFRLKDKLQEALDRSGNLFNLMHVYHKIVDGDAIFFPCEDAAVVTEVIHYPMKPRLNIWLAAGDAEQIIAKVNGDVTSFAGRLGIYELEFEGRPGWKKYAADNGFTMTQVKYVKDLRS